MKKLLLLLVLMCGVGVSLGDTSVWSTNWSSADYASNTNFHTAQFACYQDNCKLVSWALFLGCDWANWLQLNN